MRTHTSALYSAPWVLPITSPAIRNGAVAVKDGRIEAVGPVAEIRTEFGGGFEPILLNFVNGAMANAGHLSRVGSKYHAHSEFLPP